MGVLLPSVAFAHGDYGPLVAAYLLAPRDVGVEAAVTRASVDWRGNIAWAFALPLPTPGPRLEDKHWLVLGPELIVGPSPIIDKDLYGRGYLGYRYIPRRLEVGGGVSADREAKVAIRAELGILFWEMAGIADWHVLAVAEWSAVEIELGRASLRIGWNIYD